VKEPAQRFTRGRSSSGADLAFEFAEEACDLLAADAHVAGVKRRGPEQRSRVEQRIGRALEPANRLVRAPSEKLCGADLRAIEKLDRPRDYDRRSGDCRRERDEGRPDSEQRRE
jgi:hypothetical protein